MDRNGANGGARFAEASAWPSRARDWVVAALRRDPEEPEELEPGDDEPPRGDGGGHDGDGNGDGNGDGDGRGDDDQRPHAPDLKLMGTVGAWYFRHAPTEWVARHVETLEILGGRSARRRLTVDIVLPRSPRAWVERRGDDATYCVPFARLSKQLPTSFIDVRDEAGATMSLLTREENARISRRALAVATQRLLGSAPVDAALGFALDVVVDEEGIPAEIGAAVYERAATFRNQLRAGPAAERLRTIVSQLQANSIVWLLLRGRPGERRVIKLSYRIPLETPVVPARRAEEIMIEQLGIPITEEGRIAPIETARNLVARFTASAGWDAIDIKVNDPVIQDPRSYHFQIRAPGGLRVEEIRPLEWPEGSDLELYFEPLHVYMRGASGTRAMPLLLRLRVHRRGLVNLSLLASAAITSMLWFVQARQEQLTSIGESGNAEVIASVLVLVPAALVIFATRPGENPLAASLLAGVRAFVVLAGLAAAAAAAAVGDVRMTKSLSASLIIYASIATACTLAIAIAWAGTSSFVRERVAQTRRWWWGDARYENWRLLVAAISCGVAGGAADALANDAFGLRQHGARSVIGLGVLLTVVAVVAVLLRPRPRERTNETETDDGDGPPAPAPRGYAAAVGIALGATAACITALGFGVAWPYAFAQWACAAATTAVLIGYLSNVLMPLAPPVNPQLFWDEWEAGQQILERLEDLPPYPLPPAEPAELAGGDS
jgi:hypothetical protein